MSQHSFLVVIISLLSTSSFLIGQDQSFPDSLLAIANNATLSDSTRIVAANDRSKYYLDRDLPEAYAAAQLTAKMADTYGEPQLQVQAWYSLGNACRSVGKPYEALRAFKECSRLSEKSGDTSTQISALATLGVVYIRIGVLDTAEIMLSTAYELAVGGNDSLRIAQILGRYSLLKTEQGQTQAALDSLVSGFKWAPDNLRLKIFLATNMCAICNDAGLYEQGLEYCQRGLLLAEKSKSSDAIVRILNNYGEIYRGLNEVDKSLAVLQRALDLDPEPFSRLYTLNGLGIGKHLKGQSKEGIKDLLEALAIGETLNAQVERAVSLDHLARIHLDIGAYRPALEYTEQAMQLLDDLGGDPIQETELLVNYLRARTQLGLPIPPDRLEHYFTLKDSLFNNQLLADVASATERFRLAEARAENAELELSKSQSDAQLQISQQRYYGALIFLLLAAIGLFYLNHLRRRNARLAEDNEDLYSELNHRTNDNLGIMIGVLQQRQKKELAAGGDLGLLRDLEQQINVFILLQQLLSKQTGDTVNLRNFFTELTDLHAKGLLAGEGKLDLVLTCPDRQVSNRFATLMGLIVNELITNSVKYGKRQAGNLLASLTIAATEHSGLEVHYHDAGPMEAGQAQSTYSGKEGTGLIERFTKQLEGESLLTEQPFAYRVQFSNAVKG